METNFQWYYDDYEFDNRVSNLMWTICGDYTVKMSQSEKYPSSSKTLALYHGITAGGRRKYLDWSLINTYVSLRSQQGYKKEILLSLIQMGGDLMVIKQMIKDRPGILDIRQQAFQEMLEIKDFSSPKTALEKVESLLFLQLSGKNIPHLKFDSFYLAVMAVENLTETRSFLKAIDLLYCQFYHTSSEITFESLDFSNTSSKIDDLATEIDDSVKSFLKSSANSLEKFGSSADAQLVFIDPKLMKTIKKQVEHYYGESFLSQHETQKIQNRLCRGLHLDCRLHFTDGILRAACDSDFQKKYAKRDKERNLEAFKKNSLVYHRNIARLRDGLLRTLINERSPYRLTGMAGHLIANRVWRVGRSPFPKIFQRIETNDKGNFVIDLLIDASNSQQNRETTVSIQAYIVAQALFEAGIPCRVSGFSSFLNYTVLKRFRDYDDDSLSNLNIFEYACIGANRDGLAIKSIAHHLSQRSEENKILIVLSDGKPNDIKLLPKENQNPFRGETAYTGGLAVGDTAKEVRMLRQGGMMVLGVFTGNKQDLFSENLIYGKDFIYAKNSDHFSDLVMTYLKHVICQ